jgi:hypothetical protein
MNFANFKKLRFFCGTTLAVASFIFVLGIANAQTPEILDEQIDATNPVAEDIGDAGGFIYQPLSSPLDYNEWLTIEGYAIYICTNGQDNSFNTVSLLMAEDADDCLDPLADKCNNILSQDLPSWSCPAGGVEEWDINQYQEVILTGTSIYDIAGDIRPTCQVGDAVKRAICGIYVSDYPYPEYATSTSQILTADADYLAGYNGWTSLDTLPMYFKLYGTAPEPEPEMCNCDDIMASTTNWVGDIGNGIQCGFRQLTCWMLTPSPESLSDFATSTRAISEVFPFNTLYGLTNPIRDSANAQKISTTSQAFAIPMIRDKVGGGTEYYNLTVATSTTLARTIGTTNAEKFRLYLGYIIWLSMAGGILLIIF